MEQEMPKLRVGTSGVVVPTTKALFPVEYQQSSRLTYYASFFGTLEVNSSFYKLPRPATLQRWTTEVPDEFQFTLKLSRDVTHAKKLAYTVDYLNAFFDVVSRFDKMACLLVQFPASITFEYFAQVEQLVKLIIERDSHNRYQKAIEFRSKSWYNPVTHRLLDEHGLSLVQHDMPKSKNFMLNEKATFVYYRFHGPAGDYRGSYSEQFLQAQSNGIKQHLNSGKDVYAYFNNTMGDAFNNATTLMKMVAE